MPFHLYISDAEQAYLDGLPISPQARGRVEEFVRDVIANISDEFRLDPDNRPDPVGPYFFVRHVILDSEGDGRLHTIDFHIRDDSAAMGVLVIVFIDHH